MLLDARVRSCVVLALLTASCQREPLDPASPAGQAALLQSLGITNLAVSFEHGTLLTAGQLSTEQFVRIPEFGFGSLICLRPADENGTGWEEKLAADRGLKFTRIPIRGAADLTRENAERLAAAMSGPEPDAVYCASSNRVGALLAVKLHLIDGVPTEDALEFGRAHGLLGMEDAAREALSR